MAPPALSLQAMRLQGLRRAPSPFRKSYPSWDWDGRRSLDGRSPAPLPRGIGMGDAPSMVARPITEMERESAEAGLVLAPPGARMPDGGEGAYHFGGSMPPRANARSRDRSPAPLPRGIGMGDVPRKVALPRAAFGVLGRAPGSSTGWAVRTCPCASWPKDARRRLGAASGERPPALEKQ
jgi:hypothetical protein